MSLLIFMMVLFCSHTWAETEYNLTLASDYLFNGVSQTDSKPAWQASATYSHEQGFYAGVWGSNVDFGDDLITAEIDFFIGYGWQYDEQLSMDMGAISYRYFSHIDNAVFDYHELVFSASVVKRYNYKLACSFDYPGKVREGNHCIVSFTTDIGETFFGINSSVGFDYSHSFDAQNSPWGNQHGYLHSSISFYKKLSNSTIDFSLHHNAMGSTVGEPSWQSALAVSYTF